MTFNVEPTLGTLDEAKKIVGIGFNDIEDWVVTEVLIDKFGWEDVP